MRFALPVLALAAALLLVGAIQLTRADSTAASQHILTFQEVGGSGIAGTATLTAVGNDVQVVVEVTGLVEANTYISGAYNDPGPPVDCIGGLLSSFSDTFAGTAGGVTYTVANITIPGILSVSVRDVTETGEAPGRVVACAARAAPPAETPPPAEVPSTGGPPPPAGDNAFAWSYVLMAAGALALVGGGALAIRRYRA